MVFYGMVYRLLLPRDTLFKYSCGKDPSIRVPDVLLCTKPKAPNPKPYNNPKPCIRNSEAWPPTKIPKLRATAVEGLRVPLKGYYKGSIKGFRV